MKSLYTGNCVGGPMDGQEGQSRYQKGFILVHRTDDLAWIYDWESATRRFRVRTAEGMRLDDEKRWAAADGSDWDVRAL